jgi:hypothetical protein
MKTYKKLRKILKEIRLKEDGAIAGNFSAVNPGAVMGLGHTPNDTNPKQLMFKKIIRRKLPKSEK